MSKIFVDQVDPKTGTSLTLGTSGDTVNIPSGVTIANAGTATGFGVSLANGVDNRVVTASSASALNGETNFIYNGTIVGAGTDGANADLGNGLHVKIADSGASVNANRSAIVVEGTGDNGMTIASNNAGQGGLWFANQSQSDAGQIDYNHPDDSMRFYTGGGERVRIKQYDFCFGTTSPISTNGVTFKVGTTAGDDWISSYRTTASTPHYIHAFYSDAGGTQTAKYAVYADGTASAISDVNYKKNITNARNYLEDLEKIDVIKYNLKTDNEDEFKKLGFSAQQVETIFPNMIDTDNTPLKEFYEEGDEIPEGKAIGDIKKTTAREVKLLKKEIFVPMLVKAVQELSAKVKTLETENTDIKARLTALENA